MEELLYMSVSFSEVTQTQIDAILKAIEDVRGTKAGMNVYYDQPLKDEDED